MALSALIKDGQVVESASQASLSKSQKSGGQDMDKDAFLQLLVAQMKYQDPMEPTENTEWVSQYAQFSQVEELQNMAQNMSLSRASGLVGQTVIMSVENDKGEATEVEGNVDFVSYEGGNAYLSINGELYAMSDLKHVVDSKYLAAMENTKGFVEALGKLPDVNVLTLGDKSQVEEVASKYYNLSDWEKSLLGSDEFKARLDTYISRMMALVKESESADGE
jgi:flagellar basal-body rod modification protein FlgD